jgi:hypothetical protein
MYSLVLREKYQLEIKGKNAISIVHAKIVHAKKNAN